MPRLALVPMYLLACLLLGGASAAGFAVNAVLQLLAIPIIAWSLVAQRATKLSREAATLLVFAASMFALGAVQFIPLPPSVWTGLAGRAQIAQGFHSLGLPLPWLPVSLVPTDSIASLLWLLPAMGVLLGILRLGAYRPSWLAAAIIVGMVLSVLLGALQVAGGTDSSAYLYAVTNRGVAVGLFANANHFASLLVVCLPFLAALQVVATSTSNRQRSAGITVVSAALMGVILVGLAINGSLAGIGLAVPVAAASGLIVRRRRLGRWGRFAAPGIAILAAAAVAAILMGPFGNNLTTQAARGDEGSRFTSFTNTAHAVVQYAPFGSGLGTFEEVYRTLEDPAKVDRFYMNNAHNDYLQLALETGAPGIVLIVLLLVWWTRRAMNIWRADEPDVFARAATVASATILLHSFVDYPLRTAAISAVFAASLALMAKPRPKERRAHSASRDEVVHLSAD